MNPLRIPGFIIRGLYHYALENLAAISEAAWLAKAYGEPWKPS